MNNKIIDMISAINGKILERGTLTQAVGKGGGDLIDLDFKLNIQTDEFPEIVVSESPLVY
jgi:hypothetical protein